MTRNRQTALLMIYDPVGASDNFYGLPNSSVALGRVVRCSAAPPAVAATFLAFAGRSPRFPMTLALRCVSQFTPAAPTAALSGFSPPATMEKKGTTIVKVKETEKSILIIVFIRFYLLWF